MSKESLAKLHRFFTPNFFSLNEKIELPEKELHHLKHVMRIKRGQKIELVNGLGQLGIGEYDEEIVIVSVKNHDRPRHKKTLLQALPDLPHLDWIIEKGTELGITDFHLFPSVKSSLKALSESKVSRLKKIMVSALKQSKRLFLPHLHIHTNLEELQNLEGVYFLADPAGSPFSPVDDASVGFIVGPESGLTVEEIEFFKTHCKATPITLSENILRTETAAIVSAFLLSQVPSGVIS